MKDKPLKLSPLPFDEAVTDLVKVKPEPKGKAKGKREKKAPTSMQ